MERSAVSTSQNIENSPLLLSEEKRQGLREPRLRARVAVAFTLVVVFYVLWHVDLLPSDVTRALMILCGIEIISHPVYAFFLRRYGRNVLQAYLRWITDLMLITLAIHFLGGEQAFLFSFTYCLVILSTSMMAQRRDSFVLATLSAFFYLGLLLLEDSGMIARHTIWDLELGPRERVFLPLLSVMFFYLTGYFSSVFSERLHQRGQTLAIVNAISRVSSSSLALQAILDRTMNFVLDHLQAVGGVIQLTRHAIGVRDMERGTRTLPTDLPENEQHAVDRLVKILMDENRPTMIRDLRNDPMSRHLGIRWIGSLIAAPISHKGENMGLFVLFDRKSKFRDRKNRFRKEDLDLLTMIAHQITPAIVNARLYNNLEEANLSIRKAQDEIVKREKFEALGEMVSGLGHQFRNPLLAIGAAAKRMSKGNRIPESTRFYVQIIQSETEKLEKILKDVPGFHIGMDCKRLEVDINVLVERALSLVFENGTSSGIKIETEYSEMKEPLPSADPDQLEVALYNLFSNAKEAMGDQGTLRVKTRLESGVEGRILWIEVSDTGGGIPSEEVENIFNPFYTTKHWGTGLGLTMAHRIVENHGGDIRVLNRPGEGVTLQIFIPNA